MRPPSQPVVLVVDDEAGVREVLARFTGCLGYRVVTAAGGAEAVARCREERPAVAILDVRMPELDGPTTLGALRALVPDLPCLFVSGDPRPYTAPELLAWGGTAFLAKPMSLGQLRNALGRLVPTPGPCP